VARLVRDAFAHRRKALAGSLELAEPGRRDAARAALGRLGLPENARAEQLAPTDFKRLAELLG
jgi:16S rRNA A1518/A1519 N6-dimethyltransferase RsmA/KsgA/DIM1 with predicted DNA glycosylase/AP lyase activity